MNLKMKPTTIILAAALAFGLAFAVYTALTVPIIADAVNPGLYAYEWWHGNTQWYVPVNDPYVLDYALNILIAPLFDYAPRALFVGSYAIFAACVFLCGVIARKVSGKRGEDGLEVALAASAIVANIGGAASQYLVYPVWHGSTLLVGLLFIYAYLRDSRWKGFIVAALAVFGTYCDTLFIPVFIAPIAAVELAKLYRDRRTRKQVVDHFCIAGIAALSGLLGYMVKKDGGPLW
jgi:hypothetical protein